jgi:hypothetical protein
MNASTSTPKTALAGLYFPIEVTIAGVLVRLIFQSGRLWLMLRDLHALLGYKALQTGAVRRIFGAHGQDFYSYMLRLPVGRNAALFINDDGLRVVCELVKPERTQELRRWLEEGGKEHIADKARALAPQQESAAPVAAEAPATPSKVIYLDENHDPDFNLPLQPGDRIRSLYAKRPGSVVRVYHDGSACILWDDGEPQAEGLGHERMPRELLELVKRPDPGAARARRKDYCRELCRVIARYADDAEITELARTLEGVSASILARRYCPGLNAASYDVFARLGMKGGVQ